MLKTTRIGLIGAGLLLGSAPAAVPETAARPNVIVILADDLGYGDTSLFDGWVQTPQLERLAAEGLTFTDFHTNSSVCSPTRAAFLTGRYQQRVGIIDVIASHLDTPGLEPTELTIPRLLKQAGYRTALFGKWHLGPEPRHNPIHHGFDEFVGYLAGATDYHDHRDWYNGLERREIKGYATHLITDHAVRFIQENKAGPFFLYVAHQAVHLPFQTADDTVENRPKEKLTPEQMWDPNRIRPKYKIMLEEMDRGIGRIVDTVRKEGIAENTFIFFFSDNGAILAGGSNQPFRGGKFSNYEGGHRVPAIAWWPGRIAAGATTAATVMAMDLLPTIMDFTGVTVPKTRRLDGMSLANLMLHGADFPDRQLFWGYEPKLGTAMRDGQWKLLTKGDVAELYDLSRDIAERTNVADQHPERTRQMRDAIERWKQEVLPEIVPGQ
ncbi:MAG: sulfatase-like hydrolase/transferase [Verrucomicrobiales bacterium]|nr:sulfatase-like hydrolase/transferase [Verrucomicrobiales bacterium]